MRNARFFVPPASVSLESGAVVLEDREQISQLTRVLRARVGDKVEILDGSGWLYVCCLEEIAKHYIRAKILSSSKPETNLGCEIVLGVPILKGGRFEWILEKASELGASRIQPLVFERSVVRAADEGKLAHWRKVAREAAEQCERPIPAEISPAQSFSLFLSGLAGSPGTVFLCVERMAVPPLGRLLHGLCIENVYPERVVLVVGPEGGLSEAEIKLGENFSTLVSLGRQILRSETAVLFALSQVVAQVAGD